MNTETIAIVLDVALLVFFLVFAIIGFKKGFFRSLVGVVSTVVAVAVAVYCAPYVANALENAFQVCTKLTQTFADKFSSAEGYNVAYSEDALSALVTAVGVPAVLAKTVISVLGTPENAAELTVGEVFTSSLAKLIVNAACVVGLFLLCTLLLWLISKIFTKLLDHIPVLGSLNRILGMALELVKALIILYLILALVGMIPSEAIQNAIDATVVLKALRDNNLLLLIISKIPALNDFVQSFGK